LCLLNYKKDGSTFHNQFFLTPLFDAEGTLVSVRGGCSRVSQRGGSVPGLNRDEKGEMRGES